MPTPEATITRTAVKSSNINAVGYDADTMTLEVEFTGGGVYRYADVPAETHAALVKAESVGRHFAAHIRNAFKAHKVPPPTTPPETIGALLERLYPTEAERTEWLWAPQPLLDGAVPIKLIGSGRAADVHAVLKRLADGATS
jgi:hypothetical protein